MKKIMLLSLLFTVIFSSNAQALKWASVFVVWEEKVYEVRENEWIEDHEIGMNIGEVDTEANDETGSYWGNASNLYPKGTEYYEIKGTPVSTAIAVKDDKRWVKAVYDYEAPFHIMNIITNFYFIAAVIMIILIIFAVIFRNYKSKIPRSFISV